MTNLPRTNQEVLKMLSDQLFKKDSEMLRQFYTYSIPVPLEILEENYKDRFNNLEPQEQADELEALAKFLNK